MLLPASSCRRSSIWAFRAAFSASSSARRSSVSGLLFSRPLFSRPLISSMRNWFLLISAWARSGRVCALMSMLLAALSACCQRASSSTRAARRCSSTGTESLERRSDRSLLSSLTSLESVRWASLISLGALASSALRSVRRCRVSSAWLSSRCLRSSALGCALLWGSSLAEAWEEPPIRPPIPGAAWALGSAGRRASRKARARKRKEGMKRHQAMNRMPSLSVEGMSGRVHTTDVWIRPRGSHTWLKIRVVHWWFTRARRLRRVCCHRETSGPL